jgi:hypothetical protein
VHFVRSARAEHSENPLIAMPILRPDKNLMPGAPRRGKSALPRRAFTPCATPGSLLKTLRAAAKNSGDNSKAISLSPTDFGFDQIRNGNHLGGAFLPDDNLVRRGIFRGKNSQADSDSTQPTTTSKKGRNQR